MKWLFLLARETAWGQGNCPYDFVPYKFGPFSFLAYHDIAKLVDAGVFGARGDRLYLAHDAPSGLPEAEPAVGEVLSQYGRCSLDSLLAYTYRQYPWYTMLSERDDLTGGKPRRAYAEPKAYTIGYAGDTIDSFLARVLVAELAGVIDVRHNPSSRSYGFNGGTLARCLGSLGCSYTAVPELGVPAEDRRGIANSQARSALLARYQRRIRSGHSDEVDAVGDLLKRQPLALVCMESNPSACHRSVLAEEVARRSDLEVDHL